MDPKLSIHIYPPGSLFRQAWLVVKRGEYAIDSHGLGMITEHEARRAAVAARSRHLPSHLSRECQIISHWEAE